MSHTLRRVALSITWAPKDPEGLAFGSGMASVGHGQAWIPPRKGCG